MQLKNFAVTGFLFLLSLKLWDTEQSHFRTQVGQSAVTTFHGNRFLSMMQRLRLGYEVHSCLGYAAELIKIFKLFTSIFPKGVGVGEMSCNKNNLEKAFCIQISEHIIR